MLPSESPEEFTTRYTNVIKSRMQEVTVVPDEEPVIAEILDSQYLATQSAFYKDAQDGDKLVIFSKAQKAYIFRPEENKIINAGPLVVETPKSRN